MFTKSIGSSRLWIEKTQNGVGMPLKEIRNVPSNKCKDVSSGKPRLIRTVLFHNKIQMHPKIPFKKSPKMNRYVFGDVRDLY